MTHLSRIASVNIHMSAYTHQEAVSKKPKNSYYNIGVISQYINIVVFSQSLSQMNKYAILFYSSGDLMAIVMASSMAIWEWS